MTEGYSDMGEIGETNAIVIGGSIAGLLAAKVLTAHFDRVTIIERDVLHDVRGHRRGVPHGRHAHALLAGGQNVVEKLFPGFTQAIVNDGALLADTAKDGGWFIEGDFLKRAETGEYSISLSRPFLESRIREKVIQTRGIEIVEGLAVRGLELMKGRVTGVEIDDGVLSADLVVDASGRGSQTPKWLETHGYERPAEERIEVQLAYTTRHFRRRQDHFNGDVFLAIPRTADGRGGVALAQEGDRWIVTLFGYFGKNAPEDIDGFREYARLLPTPVLYEMIRDAEPLDEASTFKFPASARRRYERLKKFPDGLLTFGDAICSFNPIFGQGMSAAAMQANVLSKELKKGTKSLGKRFFRSAARVIDGPWNIAVGSDLKMPQTVGERNAMTKFFNWYIEKLHKTAHTNAAATRCFIRVAQLLDPPTAVLSPTIALRVFAKTISTNTGSAFNLRSSSLFSRRDGSSSHDERERAESV